MIQIIKLSSGEELVGSVERSANGLTISEPMYLISTEEGTKLESANLFSSASSFDLDSRFIMWSVDATEPVAKYYTAMVSYTNEFVKKHVQRQIESSTQELTESSDTGLKDVIESIFGANRITKH